MSTIKDVAKKAGVSIATVSNVLNQTKSVRPQTREKVLQAIEELQYIPNISAKSVKTSSSHSVGVIMPDLRSSIHADILNSITNYLQGHGYMVHVAFTNNSSERECISVNELLSMNVAGVILITCQPENIKFFQNRFADRNIPSVFIERMPVGFSTDYYGFNNYKSSFELTSLMLQKGYRKILLLCGPERFSSEQDCVRGFRDAFSYASAPCRDDMICRTNMTKEDAFRHYLEQYHNRSAEAIFCTSQEIATGASIAARYCGRAIPENMILFSFGRESWDNLEPEPGKFMTMRRAAYLGEQAARTLRKKIESPEQDDTVFCEIEDRFSRRLSIPPASALTKAERRPAGRRSLRILSADMASSRALAKLTYNFTGQTGINIEYDLQPQDKILKMIAEGASGYDMWMYNSAWLTYLMERKRLLSLEQFRSDTQLDLARFFPETLENCMFDGKLYGIPFTGGGQVLFYRKDLFSDPELSRRFSEQNGIPLRPPKTWNEFNLVAAFFTKGIRFDSPTDFGTSFTAANDDVLTPELLIRLWSFGGSLWNSFHQPTMNLPANVNALYNISETLDYVSPEYIHTNITEAVDEFCSGRTAMLITLPEFTYMISSRFREHMSEQVGYSTIPGACAIRTGWSFGLNPETAHHEDSAAFLDWFCERSTSYYLTILNASSPFAEPYHNYELQTLYPWLEYSEQSITHSIRRDVPSDDRHHVIPSVELESILCDAFYSVVRSNASVIDALNTAQDLAVRLYQKYEI